MKTAILLLLIITFFSTGCFWQKEKTTIFPADGDIYGIINLKSFFNDDNIKNILAKRTKTKSFADWRMDFQRNSQIDPFLLDDAYLFLSIDGNEGGIAISGQIDWSKIKTFLLKLGKKEISLSGEKFIEINKGTAVGYYKNYLLIGNKMTLVKFKNRLDNKGPQMLTKYNEYLNQLGKDAYFRMSGQIPETIKDMLPTNVKQLKKAIDFSTALQREGIDYQFILKIIFLDEKAAAEALNTIKTLKTLAQTFLGEKAAFLERCNLSLNQETISLSGKLSPTQVELFIPSFPSLNLPDLSWRKKQKK